MARISLTRSIKFRLLVRELDMPEPHVRGHLEYMWETAHEAANPILATPEIVEMAAGWVGTPGAFAAALEKVGFLDRNEYNRLQIHDYWEHCPDYVRKRKVRSEKARADAYIIEQSGQRRTTADNGSHFPPTSPAPPHPIPPRPDPARAVPSSADADEPAPTAPAPDSLAIVWNEIVRPPIPPCKSVTPERREKARDRLTEKPDLDYWRAVITRITRSPHCRGETGDWRASFDWLLKPDTHVKVMEGNYDANTKPRRVEKTAGNLENAKNALANMRTPGNVPALAKGST